MPSELIIVDMGSNPAIDGQDLPCPAHIIRLDIGGLPLAAARNAATKAASGKHLLFLDVDCIPMRGLISMMTNALRHHKALICAEARYLGPNDARGAWNEADLLHRSIAHPVRDFPSNGVREESEAGLFWTLIFGISRADFHAIGGFDEAFTGYGAEDTDFGYQARAMGLPLLFMGGAGAFHQHHESFEPPLQHFQDICRNAALFRKKWGRWSMEGWLKAFEDAGFIA